MYISSPFYIHARLFLIPGSYILSPNTNIILFFIFNFQNLRVRCGKHSSQATAKIQRSNVRQPSRIVQKRRIGSDIANVGPEGAEVAVSLQVAQAVHVAGAGVEELLRRGQGLVGIGVFRHPELLTGESISF